MTNAENIREMDDKELADFLCENADTDCKHCKFANGQKVRSEDECAAMVWLHEEVGE